MSVPIVIDEWLFHDLLGENEDKGERQEEAWRFLFKLLKICDRIVILEGSPFATKMWQFIKQSENDPLKRTLSKFFHNEIAINSSKTLLLLKEEVSPLPKHLLKLIPLDDQYLFQAHLSVKDSFILTSDERWPHKLLIHKSVKIEMRDPYLKAYLARS